MVLYIFSTGVSGTSHGKEMADYIIYNTLMHFQLGLQLRVRRQGLFICGEPDWSWAEVEPVTLKY